MDKTKRYLSVAFVVVLAIVIVVSLIGMILLKKKPVILQGQIEATEIRISGKRGTECTPRRYLGSHQ